MHSTRLHCHPTAANLETVSKKDDTCHSDVGGPLPVKIHSEKNSRSHFILCGIVYNSREKAMHFQDMKQCCKLLMYLRADFQDRRQSEMSCWSMPLLGFPQRTKGVAQWQGTFLLYLWLGIWFSGSQKQTGSAKSTVSPPRKSPANILGGKMVGHHRRPSTEGGVDFKMSFLWFPVKFLY